MFRRRVFLVASVAIVVVLAGVALVVRIAPAVTLSLVLALPGTERGLAPVLGDPVVEELSIAVDGAPLAADLYHLAAPRAALLLVHGLSPAGRRHPELVRLARLLARHGRLVLVPHFEGLASFRLSGREVAQVRAALRFLAARDSTVGVAGFSFGAGPALLAAVDAPGLALTASFGGYADLRDVIAFLTTGTHAFGGHRYEQPPEEYNRWKLLALLIGFVEDERDRRGLDLIAKQKLADPGADTNALESGLGTAARGILSLVRNRDEHAVGPLIAALPPSARVALDALSPLAVVSRLPGRLVIAHGTGDASIPFTESLRLAEASRGRATAVLLETFAHTRPLELWGSIPGRARDAARLLRLSDALLMTTR